MTFYDFSMTFSFPGFPISVRTLIHCMQYSQNYFLDILNSIETVLHVHTDMNMEEKKEVLVENYFL